MANTPKKMKDPTEAALSAIQDALHVREPDPSKDSPAMPAAGSMPADPLASEAPWPGLRSSSSSNNSSKPSKAEILDDDEIRRPEDTGSMRRPAANDDQESIGNILRAIQRRPARTSYLLASIFAGV